MGGFGPFLVISLFYAVIGLRVVIRLASDWRQAFDRTFTPADRSLVREAAFFVLLPVAVALHEVGHAVAIWSFGGRVVDWGYFVFAGFVSFDPSGFTAAERIIVALAGTVVNLLLGAAALAVVFLRRPPARAAINELLLQFTFISLLNALVIYPLLDVASGLDGDWSQIYFGEAPALSVTILVIHLAILAAGIWARRSPAVQRRIAVLTDASPHPKISHVVTGGIGVRAPRTTSADDAMLREVADRVASGWPAPVEGALAQRGEGLMLLLTWESSGLARTVSLWSPAIGDRQLFGSAVPPGAPWVPHQIGQQPATADADQLTLNLRMAMEAVDRWPAAPAP